MSDFERPEPMDADQADMAAEEMGVQPDVIEIPPALRKGIMLFEMEDGSFGFQAANDTTSMMDAFALCQRMVAGIQADMVVQKMMHVQKLAQAQQQKQSQQKRIVVPKIIPGR